MLLKGILFDLYGTLLIPKNSKKAWHNWLITFYRLMKDNGLQLSKKEFAIECDGFFTREEPLEKDDDLSIYENRIKKFAIELDILLNNSKIKKIANECVSAWHKHVKIDPETIPLLDTLNDQKSLALISNFDHPSYLYSVLSKYHLTQYFDFIAISGEIGCKKPNPQIFDITLEEMGLKAHEVVFIGDSREDIEGARNANIKSILIQRQFKKRLIGNDYFSSNREQRLRKEYLNLESYKIISSLRELYEIFDL